MVGALVHATVLLEEAVEALVVRPNGHYADGTFGRGGHSRLVLQRLDDDGLLTGFDKDAAAVEAGLLLASEDGRFSIERGSFVKMDKVFAGREKLDGILLDLGVSSPQLDDADRGFSFMKNGPLDMRMDNSSGLSAAQWLDKAEVEEIVRVLKEYGEERFARRIATAIVEHRQEARLETTQQLVRLIEKAVPRKEKNKHPATRSFQAIRIFINRELDELQQVLEVSVSLLRQGGRLVVISFHSLEDRIVKHFIRDKALGERLPAGIPVQHEPNNAVLKKVGKAVFPSKAEIAANPRARSAVMRVAEKL